jgi:D-alanyl-D-alanine carboxypeptidase
LLTLSLTVASCTGDAPPETGARGAGRTRDAISASPTNGVATPASFEADIASVQEGMNRLVDGGVLPGLVVLVRHGTDVRVLSRGQAIVVPKTPLSPRHRFRIGSITKPMVAVVVLKLVQRGLLSLGDTVDRWLPGVVPRGDRITLEELLDHSSGLADYLALPRFATAPRGKPPTPRELVRLGTSQPMLAPPGRSVHYSNTGYVLLGMIIERVTHRSLASNLQSAVFAPAGMNASSLGPPRAATAPVARGYEDGNDMTRLNLGWAWAAGAVVSDAHDVAAFFNRLLSGRLLRRKLLARMQHVGEPMPENGFSGGYGLGLAKVNTLCGTAWGHEGQLPGFSSAAWLNQKADRQVVVLANGTTDAVGPMFRSVIDTGLCGAG